MNSPLALSEAGRAARNARTLKWLRSVPEETRHNVRCLLAGHMGMPWDEVPNLSTEPLDDNTLIFIYSLFASQVDR